MIDWSRRKFLKGIGGVTLALPLFESLLSREARAQVTRHRFLMVMRAGNGIVQEGGDGGERFWPSATGAISAATMRGADATRATSVLADYAEKLLFIKKVRLPFARNSCGHSEAIPQVLTAQNHTGGSGNAALALGRSVDWHLSDALNGPGQAPLCFMAGPTSAYITNALSWSGPQQRAAADRSPRTVFMRLTGLSTAPAEVQRLIAERRKSVNDLVRGQLTTLKNDPRMSTKDKQRLDQHLTAVRDMEVQMTCDLPMDQATAVNAITAPEGNDVRADVARRFMDLAAWAFNCRLNHVATMQIGHGNDATQYIIDGQKLPSFHFISHRIYSDGSEGEAIPDAVDLHAKVDKFQMTLFKHLLDRLSSYPSAYGGTLLDDSVAVWTNDLGSGPPHDASNTPWVLAGSGGGQLNTGRVIDHNRKNVNQVLNTLINAMGVRKGDGSPVDDFGDASLAKGNVTGALVGV
ncbi:MAG: DUF1552 domain-containing protein [Myxococcaceae bacterium]|nr:DUF1552 domain-containing protein [Myxococcaceae bacterium]